ncbi:MAG: rhodanese-like domain-containing protein [Acidimicrobiaceae bacterium]|nr:rhodanese-like domain-containing protein [Acidimicrobiaceae bacterium]
MDQIENVDVATALLLIDQGALLLDVREDDEWDAGHAAAARHIPLSSVPDFLEGLPRDRIIVCVCRSGGRSACAGQFLAERGFDVVNLEGGMTAWYAAGAEMIADAMTPTVA